MNAVVTMHFRAVCTVHRADRLVRACAELPKLCEFFHIPFQSGDNDILRAMKRGYTAERWALLTSCDACCVVLLRVYVQSQATCLHCCF